MNVTLERRTYDGLMRHDSSSPVTRTAVMLTKEHPGGVRVDPTQPQLLLTDRAATRGDGIFESLLFRRGTLRALGEHLERLRTSARTMQLALPTEDQWHSAIALALSHALPEYKFASIAEAGADVSEDLPEANVKLVVSRGPEGVAPALARSTAWVVVSPVHRLASYGPENGLKVMALDRGYPAGIAQRAPWLLVGVKTLSYAVNLAAQRWAQEHGCDDAVFVSSDGIVLEGATSSVVMARRDQGGGITLVSPSHDVGLLPGTTQAAAFRAAEALGWEVAQEHLSVADLHSAEALWLVSSVRLAAAVTELDGVARPCPHKLHDALVREMDRQL